MDTRHPLLSIFNPTRLETYKTKSILRALASRHRTSMY